MRYNKRLIFVRKRGQPRYNPATSKLSTVETIENVLPCKLLDLGLDASERLFGGYIEGRKIAHVQQTCDDIYDYVQVDGLKYQVKRVLNQGKSFVLERDSIADNF